MTKTRSLSLREFIAKWKREADAYVSGSMMESPVGDMNRASATVVRRMLSELENLITDAGRSSSPVALDELEIALRVLNDHDLYEEADKLKLAVEQGTASPKGVG
jgi:hypothetical protein